MGFGDIDLEGIEKEDIENMSKVYHAKDIYENMGLSRETLNRLKSSKQYFDSMQEGIGSFLVRNMPLYAVRDSIDRVTSFHEYRDKVIGYLNLKNEDILSSMVRSLTFDETGYKGSDMCIVKPVKQKNEMSGEKYLKCGKCLYTTIVADNDDSSIMEQMFMRVSEWSKEHHIQLCGVAYIFIRFIMLNGSVEKNYYEVWIPIK